MAGGTRNKFKLWHSIEGLVALVVLQGLMVTLWPVGWTAWVILLFSIAGSLGVIYVATEVIEEVREALHMLGMLSAVVAEFVIFYAIEYWFLLSVSADSFPRLTPDAVTLLMHSLLVFVLNPVYMPGNALGKMLLVINTASALWLVLFILQNVSQIRRRSK